MHSRHTLAEDFRGLGVSPGDTVMLHASIRAVGEVAGGPDEIHLALKDALSAEGTLIMYASCPDYYDEVGKGDLPSDIEAELLEKLPVFDPLTARSQRDNGALVELLRTWPGSVVNPHVVRFVAWGKQAKFLTSEQPWNYAYGTGSALDRLQQLDGKILLLGSDHDAVTFMHYAEHVVDVPGKRVVRYRVPVVEKGARLWREVEEFDTAEPAHPNWPERLFGDLVDGYLQDTGNKIGRVGDAESVLLSARGLLAYALPRMKAMVPA